MNLPSSHELFVTPDGESKIELIDDPNVSDMTMFKINREDHTVGNMLAHECRKIIGVNYAGYRIPHPLSFHVELKIRTDSSKKPIEAFSEAIHNVTEDISSLLNSFEQSLINITQKKS